MLRRVSKFCRDHIWSMSHDYELKLRLVEAPYRTTAAQNDLTFFALTSPDDPRLAMLDRDFPRQSRSFRRDIAAGCVMVVLGDDSRTMGYFFAATQDFFDREQYRLTFEAGDGLLYAYNFYVDPTHRTKPIARVLLAEGFHWFHQNGHKELVAICRSTERALLRLYRQYKLLPTGRAIDAHKVFHRTYSFWTSART